MREIDLNGDIGEIESDRGDAALVPLLSSANIACGFHAGSPELIARSVALCLRHGVAVGAHPSFPDRAGFGRQPMALTPAEIHRAVLYQVGALHAVVRAGGAVLRHVKPHGALYNAAATDSVVADAVAAAVQHFDASLRLVGLANSRLIDAARRHGLDVIAEGFADRRYSSDGTLLPRTEAGAVIDDADEAERQVEAMVFDGSVTAGDGSRVALHVDSICLHGDGEHAVAMAERIRRMLASRGVTVRARI